MPGLMATISMHLSMVAMISPTGRNVTMTRHTIRITSLKMIWFLAHTLNYSRSQSRRKKQLYQRSPLRRPHDCQITLGSNSWPKKSHWPTTMISTLMSIKSSSSGCQLEKTSKVRTSSSTWSCLRICLGSSLKRKPSLLQRRIVFQLAPSLSRFLMKTYKRTISMVITTMRRMTSMATRTTMMTKSKKMICSITPAKSAMLCHIIPCRIMLF